MGNHGFQFLKWLKLFCYQHNIVGARSLWKSNYRKEQAKRTDIWKQFRPAALAFRDNYGVWSEFVWQLETDQHLKEFVQYATDHYNTQLAAANYRLDHPAWMKDTNNYDKLVLALDYVSRNRSRVFEFWCLYAHDKVRFLNENDQILLKLGMSFDECLAKKMKQEYNIVIHPDVNHYNGLLPAINKDGSFNTYFLQHLKKYRNRSSF